MNTRPKSTQFDIFDGRLPSLDHLDTSDGLTPTEAFELRAANYECNLRLAAGDPSRRRPNLSRPLLQSAADAGVTIEEFAAKTGLNQPSIYRAFSNAGIPFTVKEGTLPIGLGRRNRVSILKQQVMSHVRDFWLEHAAIPSVKELARIMPFSTPTIRHYYPTNEEVKKIKDGSVPSTIAEYNGLGGRLPDGEGILPQADHPSPSTLGHLPAPLWVDKSDREAFEARVATVSGKVYGLEFVSGTYQIDGVNYCDRLDGEGVDAKPLIYRWRAELANVARILAADKTI